MNCFTQETERRGQLTQELKTRHPAIRVLIFSMYDTAEHVQSAVRAGSCGYVLKDANSQEIIAAIEAVAVGGTYYSAYLANALSETAHNKLVTGREREVLILLAQGLSNKAVARRLKISVRTVETHRFNIRRKLGVENAADLAQYAIKHGLMSADIAGVRAGNRPPHKSGCK